MEIKQLLQGFLWAVLAFFSLYLGIITFTYLSFRTDIGFLLAKQDYINDKAWMTAFYIHISSSILVVLTGPFQFVKALRNKFLRLHRVLGKIYVGAILFLAAPSGFYIALYANGGIGAQIGFVLLSFLWFGCTFLAYKNAKEKKILAHKKWMIRSYALSFSAVTLRLYVPLLSLGFGLEHDFVLVVTSWVNWVPNLLVAEWIIRRVAK